MKKAVYAGSFDPFTIGHLSIARESAELFDELHILIAQNSAKVRRTKLELMVNAVSKTLAQYRNIKVVSYSGLIADYCINNDIQYLVRGLRNTSDYMYEENIAKINQEINPDLKTIYLRASNEAISSSMVWELYGYDKPVGKYLPYPIDCVIERR